MSPRNASGSTAKERSRRLRRAVGPAARFDDEACFAASFDGSKLSFVPEAVIVPRDRDDVGRVLRLANRMKVPVTVRGGGSSLTGSASPLRGGWVIDLSGWRTTRLDAEQGLIDVDPGVRIADIQTEVEAAGWFYPPDPSSKAYATIGGTIACNAGGMRGAKYGVTRDFVLSLRGFLPTGDYVEWGGHYRKFACGYNLRDLWIGSEGTLGVVTGAILRLLPKPDRRWTVLVAFPDEGAALGAVRRLLATRIFPSIVEFLDRRSVLCAERATDSVFFKDHPGRPVLLVELDGSARDLVAGRKVVNNWIREFGLASREARTERAAEALWQVRRKCSGAMFELGNTKLNEDVVVPLARQVEFYAFLEELQTDSGLEAPTFGHAADGNFHVNIMYDRDDYRQSREARKAVRRLMEKVVELGGTITGEHGIGLAKTPFLKLARNRAEIAAMKAVKDALDPNGILNPGKIFEPFEIWKHRPIQVKLPWDHR
ncbi:MAG: FAD-linked oxidase C-terminal domain-containing protein [Opitutaceae bacterium]